MKIIFIIIICFLSCSYIGVYANVFKDIKNVNDLKVKIIKDLISAEKECKIKDLEVLIKELQTAKTAKNVENVENSKKVLFQIMENGANGEYGYLDEAKSSAGVFLRYSVGMSMVIYSIFVWKDFETAKSLVIFHNCFPSRLITLSKKEFAKPALVSIAKLFMIYENRMLAKSVFGDSVIISFYQNEVRMQYLKIIENTLGKNNKEWKLFKEKWMYMSKYFVRDHELIDWFKKNLL